ncbi:MAG: TIR domain-containing protein [Thermomicrobiales bacterium]
MERMRCLRDILDELPAIPEDQEVISAWEREHEEREQRERAEGQSMSVIQSNQSSTPVRRDIFIVHGHDEGAKHAVKRFCDTILTEGESKILDEIASRGRTLIEKFEQEAATARFAIVVFTPDDLGAAKTEAGDPHERARQNVIFELGYFVGQLGRGNVCLLYKRPAEIPNDFQGVGFVEMDNNQGWHNKLLRELKAANVPISVERLIG